MSILQIYFEDLLCAPKYSFTEDCPKRQERQRPLCESVVLGEVGVRGGGTQTWQGNSTVTFNMLFRVGFTEKVTVGDMCLILAL